MSKHAYDNLHCACLQILETLDMMCFNMALNECEAALADKAPTAPTRLSAAVALLVEAMHVLVSR